MLDKSHKFFIRCVIDHTSQEEEVVISVHVAKRLGQESWVAQPIDEQGQHACSRIIFSRGEDLASEMRRKLRASGRGPRETEHYIQKALKCYNFWKDQDDAPTVDV